MKPEMIEEFRKGFTFVSDDPNKPKTPLDYMYEQQTPYQSSVVSVPSTPRYIGGGGCCGSGRLRFEIDMSKCVGDKNLT